jgi:hypothetical protein
MIPDNIFDEIFEFLEKLIDYELQEIYNKFIIKPFNNSNFSLKLIKLFIIKNIIKN